MSVGGELAMKLYDFGPAANARRVRIFLARPAFSIADITGFFVLNTAKALGIPVDERFPYVARWHDAVSARASMDV